MKRIVPSAFALWATRLIRLFTPCWSMPFPPRATISSSSVTFTWHRSCCLKSRTETLQKQYTWLGNTLLSINPYATMSYNADAARDQHIASGSAKGPAIPHVWSLASKAFSNAVIANQGHQSILISGESGSGKTENTKSVVRYLGKLSSAHACNSFQQAIATNIEAVIGDSNPILEAFGNAKTVRNDNSSRFGKYTKLLFNRHSGVMIGASMETYLLEKSRVVSHEDDERNYHIFYALVAGANSQKFAALGDLLHLKGKTAADFSYLLKPNKAPVDRLNAHGKVADEIQEFSTVCSALTTMGISEAQQRSIWSVLASILFLGEVRFETSETSGKATLAEHSRHHLNLACALTGLKSEDILTTMLEKSKSKFMTTMSTAAEGESFRDALCKGLYVAVFDALIAIINRKMAPKKSTAADVVHIGVLDIFGFENFKTNGFEQLCINYANEVLQSHYNRFTFLNDEAECQAEGMPCPAMTFPNNDACVRLVDMQKKGIFSALNEESGFKGGTDERFTQILFDTWGRSNKADDEARHFIQPKSTRAESFGVSHFAAPVSYHTKGWVEKNIDFVKSDMVDVVRSSSDPFIAALLSESGKRQTVSQTFQTQLRMLMAEIAQTSTQFVRCVKPNTTGRPQLFDGGYVAPQLESAGIVQVIALKRNGYPIRMPNQEFAKRYGGRTSASPSATVASFTRLCDWSPEGLQNRRSRRAKYLQSKMKMDDAASRRQAAVDVPEGPYMAVGKTKIFLKQCAFEKLERFWRFTQVRRMRLVTPYLRQWARRYRAKNEAALRRRNDEFSHLMKTSTNRGTLSREVIKAAADNSGLPHEKIPWFLEALELFQNFDIPVLLDVVFNVGAKEKAFHCLADMQRQRLDSALPDFLRTTLKNLGVGDAVVERLAVAGVVSTAKLSALSAQDLRDFGFSTDRIAAVSEYLLSQQSAVIMNERLAEACMSVRDASVFNRVINEVKEETKKANAQPSHGADVQKLTSMGLGSPEECLAALQRNNGSIERAVTDLLSATESAPARSQGPPPARANSVVSPDAQKVDYLVTLGFERGYATSALVKSNNDVDKAISFLIH